MFAGTYYPAVSLYFGATVRLNPGPSFLYPPLDLYVTPIPSPQEGEDPLRESSAHCDVKIETSAGDEIIPKIEGFVDGHVVDIPSPAQSPAPFDPALLLRSRPVSDLVLPIPEGDEGDPDLGVVEDLHGSVETKEIVKVEEKEAETEKVKTEEKDQEREKANIEPQEDKSGEKKKKRKRKEDVKESGGPKKKHQKKAKGKESSGAGKEKDVSKAKQERKGEKPGSSDDKSKNPNEKGTAADGAGDKGAHAIPFHLVVGDGGSQMEVDSTGT
jgi:hypothetical protein